MGGIRYRKDIDCLTDDELHDLREALAAMYLLPASNPSSFAVQASFHGGPPTEYCRHGAPGLLTWHRAYLKAFEDALRSIGCEVSVPFWDWSSGPSTGVPKACREATYVNRSGTTVPNPLYSGPRSGGGGQTVRRADIDTTVFDDLAVSAQSAMSATTFDSFQNQINGVHGAVHGRVNGDMGSVPTAAYDPIFYLHHANLDRLWAAWQADHPGALPATEATFELPPFNRPFSTQWQQGSDVESTDALGYRYRTFCLFIPAIDLWKFAQIRWPWPIRERMKSARLLVKSDRMQPRPLEVRVFIDQPEATESSKRVGNPGFAGVFGFMGHAGDLREAEVDALHCPECARLGHTDEHAHHAQHVHDHGGEHGGVQERFDVELDVTDAVRNARREAEEIGLKLVAVDANGEPVQAEDVLLEGIEVVVD